MKCPDCGCEMKKGFVEARNAGSLLNTTTTVRWYPQDQRDKVFIRKNAVSLPIDTEGWYCDDCMQVVAVFQQKFM